MGIPNFTKSGLDLTKEVLPGITVRLAFMIKKQVAAELDRHGIPNSNGLIFGEGFDALDEVYSYSHKEHTERLKLIREIIAKMETDHEIEQDDIEIEDGLVKTYESIRAKSFALNGGYVDGGKYWVGISDISRMRIIVKDNEVLNKFINFCISMIGGGDTPYRIAHYTNKYHRGIQSSSLYPCVVIHIAKKDSTHNYGGDEYGYDLRSLKDHIKQIQKMIPESHMRDKARRFLNAEKVEMKVQLELGRYSRPQKNRKSRHRQRGEIKTEALKILDRGIAQYLKLPGLRRDHADKILEQLNVIQGSSWKFEKKYGALIDLLSELEGDKVVQEVIIGMKVTMRALLKIYGKLRESEKDAKIEGTEKNRMHDILTEIQIMTRNVRGVSESNRDMYIRGKRTKGVYAVYNLKLLQAIVSDSEIAAL